MSKYRFGVSSKLFLAFSIFTLAVILAGLGSIYYINKMSDLFESIYNDNMAAISAVNDVESQINSLMINTYRYLGTQDPDVLNNIEEAMNKDVSLIYDSFHNNEGKYQEVGFALEQFNRSRFKAMEDHLNFNTQLAYQEMNKNGQERFLVVEQLMSSISDKESSNAYQQLGLAINIKEGIILYLIIVIVARIILNSTIGFLVFRAITLPLIELVHFIRELHRTSNFSRTLEIKHKDEMGDAAREINGLASSLSSVIQNIGSVLEENSSGNFSSRVSMPLVGDLHKLKQSVNDSTEQIHNTITKINFIMNCVAKGDYTQRIDIELKGELSHLKDNINLTIGKLANTFDSLNSEIKERTNAEKALKKKSAELITLSRLVGRADIATSTLHNVGNVLNSLNTSSYAIGDGLQRLNLSEQEKLITFLKSKGDTVGDYLAVPENSSLLLEYLEKSKVLTQVVKNELFEENEKLSQHINHVARIIARQQKHAKLYNYIEELSLEDVVNNAANLANFDSEKMNLQLCNTLSKCPTFSSDKDKVLQILTNIIKNAICAIEQAESTNFLINIDVELLEEYFILTIEDDGIGLQPDIESKIFTIGFTTNENGHGFGLHHSALMAKELSGKLEFENKGVGIGMIFKLTLPYSLTTEGTPNE